LDEFKLPTLLLIMLGVTTLRFFLCILFVLLKVLIGVLNLEKESPYLPAPLLPPPSPNSYNDFQLISPFLVANLPILNINLIFDPFLI